MIFSLQFYFNKVFWTFIFWEILTQYRAERCVWWGRGKRSSWMF